MPRNELTKVDNALRIILETLNTKNSELIETKNSFNRILASDVVSKVNHPSANLSSMDGYAINIKKKLKPCYNVVGTSSAGNPLNKNLKIDDAVRIFTGAIIPKNSNKIVLQEDVTLEKDKIVLKKQISTGNFIRKKGMDFKKNEIILTKGTKINSRNISLIFLSGNKKVRVYKKPKIGILSSGDELVRDITHSKSGQVINSNSIFLKHLILSNNCIPVDFGIIRDKPNQLLKKTKQKKFKDVDLVISTGGASVGDKDFLIKEFKLKADIIKIWKIAMKPGKPLFFGEFNGKPFIGLPGNPVSVGVCSLMFLLPAIFRLKGENFKHKIILAKTKMKLSKNGIRKDFIRANLYVNEKNKNFVTFKKLQDSSMLRTFSHSNCLIIREPYSKEVKINELVKVIMFPDYF